MSTKFCCSAVCVLFSSIDYDTSWSGVYGLLCFFHDLIYLSKSGFEMTIDCPRL